MGSKTGAYLVSIDDEQQKVSVAGSVEAPTLIKKLVRAGKHAELWGSQKGANGGVRLNNGNCGNKKSGISIPNQNVGMKGNSPGGIDEKTMAALRMNLGGEGGKIGGNDINAMMNLAGFHGNNGGNNVNPTVLLPQQDFTTTYSNQTKPI
nr:heavy metal-associated isoprenylated plant protein 37 [Ipomoea batatas]